MIYILDAHNIMFKMYDSINYTDHQYLREDFIKQISNLPISKNNKIIIVFDGQSYSQTSKKNSNIQIIYSSSKGQKADGVIKKLSEKYEQNKVTVISSDRAVVKYVKQGGLNVVSSDQFIKKYFHKNKKIENLTSHKEKQINTEKIEYWKKIFNEK